MKTTLKGGGGGGGWEVAYVTSLSYCTCNRIMIPCRPLNYPCTMSTAICDFSIIKATTEGSIRLNAYIRKLYLPVPAMAGPLLMCFGVRYMFWLRPLMTQNRDFLCKAVYPSKDTGNVIVLDHNSNGNRYL